MLNLDRAIQNMGDFSNTDSSVSPCLNQDTGTNYYTGATPASWNLGSSNEYVGVLLDTHAKLFLAKLKSPSEKRQSIYNTFSSFLRFLTPVFGLKEHSSSPEDAVSYSLVSALNYADSDCRTLFRRLVDLVREPEFDEEGYRLQPTDYSFQSALNILSVIALLRDGKVPKAAVSTDTMGGIRVQWRKGSRQLRLIFPAEKTGYSYLYQQEGELYHLNWSPSPVELMKLLNWLEDMNGDGN